MAEKRIKLSETQWSILLQNENEINGIKTTLDTAHAKQQMAIALVLDACEMADQQFQVDPQTKEMVFQIPDSP